MLDPEACYQALLARDERFDGRVFVGVRSTGIYCRPVCPAKTPKRQHCEFFACAAAAQDAGFRPCLRCRPEVAPQTAAWAGTASTVSRALSLIAEGDLDGEDASVERLAARLGLGERQLRRLFDKHLGASPMSVAQTRRVLFAKQLLHETSLPMTQVALASGFGSVRRFNEAFRGMFQRPPSEIRGARKQAVPEQSLGLKIRYRQPFAWQAALEHLQIRALAGIEWIASGTYRRTLELQGAPVIIEVVNMVDESSLAVRVHGAPVRALPSLANAVRRLFDTACDVEAIRRHLAKDPELRAVLRAFPGLRVWGGVDGFECAVRTILLQQVSLAAGKRLLEQLVQICGRALPNEALGLSRLFPTALDVAAADLASLRMPMARKRALHHVAHAALEDPRLFSPGPSLLETLRSLTRITGIGDWSANVIAMRAQREPDAFAASDAGLLRGAAGLMGHRPTPAELSLRAETWRPFRAYAAQYLWAHDAALRDTT